MSNLCEQFHKLAINEYEARQEFKAKYTDDLDEVS